MLQVDKALHLAIPPLARPPPDPSPTLRRPTTVNANMAVYEIGAVQAGDSGVYQCTAVNAAGEEQTA